MLAHGSEHNPEEPAISASGAGFEEMEIVLLALDGAFGTGACVFVEIPECAIPGDESVEAIVLLGIGVEDTAVGGVRTALSEVGARSDVWRFLGGGQWATPLEAQAVRAEAPGLHGQASLADGDALLETEGTSVAQVVRVALVEGDDESHLPALGGQAKEAQGIVGGIQGGGLDR
jgi:hypothetical protein